MYESSTSGSSVSRGAASGGVFCGESASESSRYEAAASGSLDYIGLTIHAPSSGGSDSGCDAAGVRAFAGAMPGEDRWRVARRRAGVMSAFLARHDECVGEGVPLHDVATRWCGRPRAGAVVGVACDSEARGVSLTSVQHCNSVARCPVCSERIRTARAGELSGVLAAAAAAGLRVLFITLTVRHDASDSCCEVWDLCSRAWSRWRRRAAVSRLFAVSRAWWRAVDATCSMRTGWHVHLHVLVFVPAGSMDLAAWREAVLGEWVLAVEACGGAASRRGQLVEEGSLADASRMAWYAAKASWSGLSLEAVSSSGVSSGGGYSPFMLLDLLSAGGSAAWADRMLVEWCVGSYGRRVFQASRGWAAFVSSLPVSAGAGAVWSSRAAVAASRDDVRASRVALPCAVMTHGAAVRVSSLPVSVRVAVLDDLRHAEVAVACAAAGLVLVPSGVWCGGRRVGVGGVPLAYLDTVDGVLGSALNADSTLSACVRHDGFVSVAGLRRLGLSAGDVVFNEVWRLEGEVALMLAWRGLSVDDALPYLPELGVGDDVLAGVDVALDDFPDVPVFDESLAGVGDDVLAVDDVLDDFPDVLDGFTGVMPASG